MLVNFDSLKTFYNALKQKMKNYRGNWNQNDHTADDYIKNRPFYSEVGTVEILPKITLTGAPFTLKESLKRGEKYTIIFDDVEYTSIAKEYDGYIMIGNNAVYQWDGGIETDTGEPFAIEVEDNSLEAWCYTIYDSMPNDTMGTVSTHTVQILRDSEIVHKLDKKFVPIPDDVVSEDDLANVAFSGDYNDLYNTPTIYDDVVRYGITQSLSEAQKTIARENVGAGDGNYNNLKNKPCGKKIITSGAVFHEYHTDVTNMNGVGFANVVTNKQFFPSSDSYDEVVIQDVICKTTIEQYNNIVYSGNPHLCHLVYSNSSLPNIDTGESFCLEYLTSGSNSYVRIYTTIITNGSLTCIAKKADTFEYIPLDEGYIPDTIARVSDVPDNVYTKEETYSKEEIYTKEETYTKEEADAKFFSSDATVDEIANVVLERLPTWEGGSY